MASRTAYSTWTPQKPTLFDGHYLGNRSTLDIGVLSYIGIVQHKEHSPEVLSIPPGTPCIVITACDCSKMSLKRRNLNVHLFDTNRHTVVISDFHAFRKPRGVILVPVKKLIFEEPG